MPIDRSSSAQPEREPSLGPDDLRWLQTLARRMARTSSEADDLVQETWLVARQATNVEPRSCRAWLYGVLRNRERMLRRSEARRRRREEAAHEGSVPSGADLELHRQRVLASLREALDDLDETDRSLLLARYCDENNAPELAERLGLPASTVRSRLSRATARVRQSLDERWGGDRRAWAPAVLAYPSTARVGGPALAENEWTVMTAVGTKIAIVVVAVLAAVGWWVGTGMLGAPDQGGGTDPESTTAEAQDERAALLARKHAEHQQSPLDATPATLDGRVVAADTGEPVAGAVVMVMQRGPRRPAIVPRVLTGADGSFHVEQLPAGRYTITAASLGRLPARHDAVELAPGAREGGLVLRMAAGGNVLDGTITDIWGGPVEGALVQAIRAHAVDEKQRGTFGTLTDAEGRYALTLPDGSWAVEAGGEDYSLARQNVRLARGPGLADFALVPGAEIHGRVVERATGKAVAGATVGYGKRMRHGRMWSSGVSYWRDTAVTDTQGRFVLRPLEPAEYALWATAPGLATLAGPRVHAAIGEEVTDVEVVVDPAFDASGFVVDEGDPSRGLGGVELSVMLAGADMRHFAVTEPDGYFELHGLRPGSHVALLEGGGVVRSAFEHQLRIDGADRSDVIFELECGVALRGWVEPAVSGTVRVKRRKEHGGLEVMVEGMKLQAASAPLAEDGTFTITSVPPGAWKLVAEGEDGSRGELEIDVGEQSLEGILVPVAPRSRVAGVVRDGEGTPLPGLAVRLQAGPDPTRPPSPLLRGPQTIGSAVTAADGSFVVQGVEPGRYSLAIVDGRQQAVTITGEAEPSVEVTAGRDPEALELRVELPHGRIVGAVQGPDGEPVADAWVVVTAAGENDLERRTPPTITDPDGRFLFEGLAAGTYDVHVRGPDADARGSVEGVAIGATVTVPLEALGVLHGVVTRGGAPVPRFELDLSGLSGLGGRHTVISADGTFTLERLEPGSHRVSVTTDEGAASTKVEVEPGGSPRVELEIGEWGSLEGVLVSATDGQPLAGVTLIVHSDSGQREAKERLLGQWFGGLETDVQGRFSVDGVGPGEGRIAFQIGNRMMSSGEPLGSRAYVLEAGQRLDLGAVVALAPAGVPKTERGSLGIEARAQHAHSGEAGPEGAPQPVAITWLEAGGPAERAGVQVGDRVLAFEGIAEAALGTSTLLDAMAPTRIRTGQSYALQLERDGKPFMVKIVAVTAK